MCDELRQPFALLPCCSKPCIWVAKPSESSVKKFVCRRRLPAGSLPVERPAKDKLRRTIMIGSKPSEPMVDQRGLPDTSPGDDCNDIYLAVFPGGIQKSDILLSTKNVAPGNGQS